MLGISMAVRRVTLIEEEGNHYIMDKTMCHLGRQGVYRFSMRL